MEINWIIFAVVLVCALALILFLIIRNMKDKKNVIDSLNEPEIDEDSKPQEKEEN
jgi:preprotein translocase subunit YajC